MFGCSEQKKKSGVCFSIYNIIKELPYAEKNLSAFDYIKETLGIKWPNKNRVFESI